MMASGNDLSNSNIDKARKTYEGFTGFVKWGAIVSAAVTIFVVLLIAS